MAVRSLYLLTVVYMIGNSNMRNASISHFKDSMKYTISLYT